MNTMSTMNKYDHRDKTQSAQEIMRLLAECGEEMRKPSKLPDIAISQKELRERAYYFFDALVDNGESLEVQIVEMVKYIASGKSVPEIYWMTGRDE